MALVFNDRVKETSVTTGTGTLTLDGAVQGFETFSSAIGNSNTTYYAIELPGTTEFEVGRGTISAGQLARTEIISSSNSDSAVDFSAGTKIVFCTLPASKAVIKDASGNISIDANKTIEFGDSGETISGDGTHLTIAGSDHINVNAQGELTLSSESNEIFFRDGSTLFLKLQRDGDFNVNFTSNQDKKIEFIGNDGGSTVDMLVLDGAEAGKATFSDNVVLGENKVIEFGDSGETISGDGTDMTVSSSGILNLNSSAATGVAIRLQSSAGGVIVDASSLIVLDADSADNGIQYKDGATEMLRIHNSSSDVILHTKVQDKDLIFKGNDGGSDITALTLDMSEAGAATFNDKIILGANKAIEFGDAGENISGDGTNLTVTSSGFFLLDVTGNILLDSANNGFIALRDNGTSYINFSENSSDAILTTPINDGDFLIKGNDGGSTITALTLDMSEAGAATFNSTVTANAGVIVDNITIDGTEIDLSSGDLTIDVAGQINLDADSNGLVTINDGGTQVGSFFKTASTFSIKSDVQDKRLEIKGNDGGSEVVALAFHMANAGQANFNDKIVLNANKVIEFGDSGETISGDGTNLTIASGSQTIVDSTGNIQLKVGSASGALELDIGGTSIAKFENSSNTVQLRAVVQDKDIEFRGNDGGSQFTALSLDMSEAGAATFNDKIILGANKAIEFGDSGETITGDGTNLTIASSQNLILDAANELKLDSTVGINLLDDGSSYGLLVDASGDFVIKSQQSDKDIIIKGNDGGSTIEAMRIDMSEGGRIGIGTSTPARDLQIAKSTSGGAVRLEVNNESNTGSSHGVISIYSGGTSGGDPYLHFKVESGEQYSIGIDNDQSDALVFSNGFGVGSNNLLSIATDGSATFTGTVTANGETLSAGVSAGFAVAMAIAL